MRTVYTQLKSIDYLHVLEWYPQTEQIFVNSNIRDKGNYILVSQFDGIGDAVLISGVIKEIKNYYQKPLIVACYDFVSSLFEINPYIDKIITLNADLVNFNYILDKIYNELWSNNIFIEQAFHLQCFEVNNTALLFNYLSGAKYRIGYYENSFNNEELNDIEKSLMNRHNNNHDSKLLTNAYTLPRNITHMVDRHYYLFESYVNNQFDHDTYVYPQNTNIVSYIDKNKKNIIVNLGGSKKFKQYPPKQLNKFLSTIDNENIILIGGKDVNNKHITCKHINLIGKTSLIESIDLINNCDLYIGNDSGMTHIAAACKKPCIVFYKESLDSFQYFPERLSSWLQFKPYKTKSVCLRPERRLIPCSRETYTFGGCIAIHQNHCIRQIPVEDIISAYKQLI